MKVRSVLGLVGCLLWALCVDVRGGEEVDRLLEEYAKIETVTCQVRRVRKGPRGKVRFLSRVYYANDDRIHAEGIAPLRRRTIADGKRLYQYVEGAPRGFSRPIDDLSEEMKISLRHVPGTAMDHLLRLKEQEETLLTPSDTAARRVALETDDRYVVLSFDDKRRLVGIEFFASKSAEVPVARYEYRDFREALPGVWVPLKHEAEVRDGEAEFTEVTRVDRFVANEPVAASLFEPESFFPNGLDFVDEFADIVGNKGGK